MKTMTRNIVRNIARLLFVLLVGIALLGGMAACGEKPVELVSITASGSYQTEYKEGEIFRPKGLVVTANYSDGSVSDPLTTRDYTYTKTPLTAGENTIVISYTEGEKTVETSLKVTATAVVTDTGTLVDYRFEAEEATIYGTGGSSAKDLYTHASVPNSYKFGTEFSGNICMYNARGMRYEYIFNSDKAVKVRLTLRHGVYRSSGFIYGNSIFSHFAITNNGESVEELDPVGNDSDETYVKSSISNYFDLISTDVAVELQAGENVLVIAPTTAIVNLDYIELHTSAQITGFEPSYIQDPEYSVVLRNLPTATSTGRLAFIDTTETETPYSTVYYTLPALSETDYDMVDGDYYLTVAGKTLRMTANNAQSYTFTIQSSDVVFADTKSNTVEVKEGMFLPNVVCRERNASVLKWKDGEGREYNADGYTMPAENVTLQPVVGIAKNVTSGNGKLDLGADSQRKYYIDQGVNQHMGYENPRDTTQIDDTTVNGSSGKQKPSARKYREEGENTYLLFALQGEANRLFRFATEYYSQINTTYALTYTFKNFSDSLGSITFDLVLQNATDPYGMHYQHSDITLAPGEEITLTYRPYSVENATVWWSYIVMLEKCDGVNLGVSAYINEHDDVWQEIYGAQA